MPKDVLTVTGRRGADVYILVFEAAHHERVGHLLDVWSIDPEMPLSEGYARTLWQRVCAMPSEDDLAETHSQRTLVGES